MQEKNKHQRKDFQMHYEDMDFYGTVIESKEYNVIQRYFHKNDCLSPKIIGHMTYLCRQSKANSYNEWIQYYGNTEYAKNIDISILLMQETLARNNLCYSDEIVENCIKAFIFYQTWRGVEKEKEVTKLLSDDDFYCLYPYSDIDLYYNVDIVLISKKLKRWVAGIQVKPSSFTEDQAARERISKFQKRFRIPVLYIRYDRYTKELFEVDIENVQLYKRNILK
ncbi:MAG: MjaI family restriction endonuclease [Agathobacter sp.]